MTVDFPGDPLSDFIEIKEPKKELGSAFLLNLEGVGWLRRQAWKSGHRWLGSAYHEFWDIRQVTSSLCPVVFMSVKEGNKQTIEQFTDMCLWPHVYLLTVSSPLGISIFQLPRMVLLHSRCLWRINLLASSLLPVFSLTWNFGTWFGFLQEDPGHPYATHHCIAR